MTDQNLLNKSILIYGLGSYWQELFNLRFLSQLKGCGVKKVSYFCHDSFRLLLRRGIENVEVLKLPPDDSQYDYVFQSPDILGFLDKKQPNKFAEEISFGAPVVSNLNVIQNLLPRNGRENIAVIWESDNLETAGLKMRISPILLGECLRYSDANILVLQKNPNAYDIRQLERGLRRKVFNYGFIYDSVDDTYAFLSEMDQYISVGDHNVHLASSLGVKVSVLLPSPPQWQWLTSGKVSPWFPTVKIYRQDISGDWDKACDELTRELLD